MKATTGLVFSDSESSWTVQLLQSRGHASIPLRNHVICRSLAKSLGCSSVSLTVRPVGAQCGIAPLGTTTSAWPMLLQCVRLLTHHRTLVALRSTDLAGIAHGGGVRRTA